MGSCFGTKPVPDATSGHSNDEQPFSNLFKLVMLGDSNTGKSSLILRYCDNTFLDQHVASIGADFKVKYVTVNKKSVKLQIWDTAGQEKYRQMTQSYFGGANGVVVCMDLSLDFHASKKNITRWVAEANSLKTTQMSIFLVGTKSDLPRKAQTEECKSFASSLGATYFETSAKTGSQIEETFQAISNRCLENFDS